MHQHYRKEHLNIGTVAKFESDLLKSNEDIAPQSRQAYRHLYIVWWGPHHRDVCKFCNSLPA